jgi:hypothetical protein
MRAERIFGHQLLCHSTRKFRPNASGNVNLRQLLQARAVPLRDRLVPYPIVN